MSQPVISLIAQRHVADCGVAALSMLLRISYEDALLALGGEAPKILRGGVWLAQMQRAAAKLGAPLKIKRKWDADDDEGIAQIRFKQGGDYHVIVVRSGLFFDTDLSCWHPDDYLKSKRAETGPLLVRTDE